MLPKRGDIIFSIRMCGLYFHYGVYVGNNEVVHYRSKDDGFFNAGIIKTSLKDFSNGCPTYIEPVETGALSYEQTAANAEKYIGSGFKEYNLVINNCEHFVNLCRYNEKRSCQVRDTFWEAARVIAGLTPDLVSLFAGNVVTIPSVIAKMISLVSLSPSLFPIYHTLGNHIHSLGLEKVSLNYREPTKDEFAIHFNQIVKRCKCCGAPMPKGADECIYCGKLNNHDEQIIEKEKNPTIQNSNHRGNGSPQNNMMMYLMYTQMTQQQMMIQQQQMMRNAGMMSPQYGFYQPQQYIPAPPPSPVFYPHYKVSVNGQPASGWYSLEQLQHSVQMGKIAEQTIVYKYTSATDSVRYVANEIPELAALFNKQ